MKKNILKITALVFVLILTGFTLASCAAENASQDKAVSETYYSEESAKGLSSYGYKAEGISESDSFDFEVQENEPPADAENSLSSPGLSIEDSQARKIIRNARLDVETKEFEKFIKDTEKAISQFKGYIESSEIYGNSYYSSSYRSANITARIPAENLDNFIGIIGETGNITSKSLTANDITAKYTDIQARIDSYEAERTALTALLEKADKIDDIIRLRDKLAEVNTDLDSLKRQIKSFDSQITYSAVALNISEVDRVSPINEKKGFFKELGEKLSANLYNIARGARNLAIGFISSLPYLVIFAVIITAFVLIIRKVFKKRKARRAKTAERTEE